MGVVIEAAVRPHYFVERVLARVTERSVAKVVSERERLGEVLVEPQRARNRPRDLRDFERVRQAITKIIALHDADENLGFVLKPAKSGGMDDTIAVALKAPAVRRVAIGMRAPARI